MLIPRKFESRDPN